MAMQDDPTGLADFVPMTRVVPLRTGPIEIRPLTIRTLPAFSRAVQPILPLLMAGQLAAALTTAPEAMLAAISAATGIPEADLPEDPAEFVGLAAAAIEVNLDFFTRRLLPADRAAGAAIRQLVDRDGASSSPGSSSADGDTPTSST